MSYKYSESNHRGYNNNSGLVYKNCGLNQYKTKMFEKPIEFDYYENKENVDETLDNLNDDYVVSDKTSNPFNETEEQQKIPYPYLDTNFRREEFRKEKMLDKEEADNIQAPRQGTFITRDNESKKKGKKPFKKLYETMKDLRNS
jgi:hypothetical protein